MIESIVAHVYDNHLIYIYKWIYQSLYRRKHIYQPKNTDIVIITLSTLNKWSHIKKPSFNSKTLI